MIRLALIGLLLTGCGTRLTADTTSLDTAGVPIDKSDTDTDKDPAPTVPLCNTNCTTSNEVDSGGSGAKNTGGSGIGGSGYGGSGAGGSGL